MRNIDTILQSGSIDEIQDYFLLGVSRTFALTIPALPDLLRTAVSNGYLLCRIVDCIEDDPELVLEQKKFFSNQFINVVDGNDKATEFAQALLPLLSDATIPEEKELIKCTPEVIKITHSFGPEQREALSTCVHIMAEGMMHYQELDTSKGVQSISELERYCYYVAGVVGELLTRLYCNYSDEIENNRSSLMKLSVCFGQGLQMTNIIKDIWTDKERNVCWLPRAEFEKHGFNLNDLVVGDNGRGFEKGVAELIGVAHLRLSEALDYTLLIPRQETGIRNFCLFAIGMALLSLKKIHGSKQFLSGHEVKISRNSVKLVIILSRVFVRSNLMLKFFFKVAGWGLPINHNS